MQHEHTEHRAAAPDAGCAAISDVTLLPRFVPQVIAARGAGEGRIGVDARWFRIASLTDGRLSVSPGQRAAAWAGSQPITGIMTSDDEPGGMGRPPMDGARTLNGRRRGRTLRNPQRWHGD